LTQIDAILLSLKSQFTSPMPNTIQIKAFGMVAEKIGAPSLELQNPGSTALLKEQLFARFPELTTIKFGIALDKRMIQSDVEISDGVEIALLPPFSGG
jgi:molybdopterin synthase sulfur carrier subunit